MDRRLLLRSLKKISELKHGSAIDHMNYVRITAGIHISDPNTFYVTASTADKIRVGKETIILPNVKLIGEVHIGDSCIIGPDCTIDTCHIGDESEIGPAQMKRTVTGRGLKAKHDCYLGDALIGNYVNIGAGTITGNYNGVEKLMTIIEDGAFIGTNVNIIAPSKISQEAMVAAGSTVAGYIPPYTMIIARSRQHQSETHYHKKTNRGYELIVLNPDLMELLKSVIGRGQDGKEKMYEWLITSNALFDKKPPLDMLLNGKEELLKSMLTRVQASMDSAMKRRLY